MSSSRPNVVAFPLGKPFENPMSEPFVPVGTGIGAGGDVTGTVVGGTVVVVGAGAVVLGGGGGGAAALTVNEGMASAAVDGPILPGATVQPFADSVEWTPMERL